MTRCSDFSRVWKKRRNKARKHSYSNSLRQLRRFAESARGKRKLARIWGDRVILWSKERGSMTPFVAQRRAEIEALCRRYGVRRLELFGSTAAGQDRPGESDLDFLVEFQMSQSVLELAFLPTIHRTYREIRAWFQEISTEDTAQQTLLLFLELAASTVAAGLLGGQLSFAVARSLHRNMLRWEPALKKYFAAPGLFLFLVAD